VHSFRVATFCFRAAPVPSSLSLSLATATLERLQHSAGPIFPQNRTCAPRGVHAIRTQRCKPAGRAVHKVAPARSTTSQMQKQI